jgi:hypothetical protein
MHKEPIIFALDKDGNPCFRELFRDFLKSILPALVERADEIAIRGAFTREGWKINVEYRRLETNRCFPIERDFGFTTVLTRISVLAGMGLGKWQMQPGEMSIRFGDNRIPVAVQLELDETSGLILLKPDWNRSVAAR